MFVISPAYSIPQKRPRYSTPFASNRDRTAWSTQQLSCLLIPTKRRGLTSYVNSGGVVKSPVWRQETYVYII